MVSSKLMSTSIHPYDGPKIKIRAIKKIKKINTKRPLYNGCKTYMQNVNVHGELWCDLCISCGTIRSQHASLQIGSY
jgi:hypothetical protein